MCSTGRNVWHRFYELCKSLRKRGVIEPLLLGIVLGLIPVTLAGLFVAAYMQYRRGDQLNF